MHIAGSRSHPNNEWYSELCALAAIGELSRSEYDELNQHLAECAECRELYADFRRLAAHDLGLLAAERQSEPPDQAADPLDESALLTRLLDRASRERAALPAPAPAPQQDSANRAARRGFEGLDLWLRRPALSYGSLALLLSIVAGIGAYRLREAQLRPTLEGLNSELRDWQGRVRAGETQQKSLSGQLAQVQAERNALRKSLALEQAKSAQLQSERRMLDSQIASARAQFDQAGQSLEAAKSGASERQQQITHLEFQLSEATRHAQEQDRLVAGLRNRLAAAEQVAASTPLGQGFTDADAKDLFGARDLHIVDVYDVGPGGKQKRSYGRVYYVEKKLLIFYAFDLEDKKNNRAAAGFQAWGYRQPNESKPENLGLFNLDDASANRWVLRVNNPRVLEHVDAVFVTLESADGSPTPRGRRLLYANLAGPPNHP